MYYNGVDLSYLVFVIPPLIFALWAQFRVKSAFSKYSKVPSDRGMTGADAARMVLNANGIGDVRIERVNGELTDHYDPKANVIRLSNSTYDARTAAAVGVAAHEAGHAAQYASQYLPIKIRASILPVTNIGSNLAFPIVLIGLLFSFQPLLYIGVAFFGLAVIFQLVTLPVEFNASRRALECLSASGLSEESVKAAKKVLTAAALTYVAALATAIGNFLRLLSIANRGRRR
ncbi:MAG: zinc metallopeptidase [Clostridiales bacterium]|nr:zinc metallopeptidase [Clostridiales bacterium]